MDGVEAMVPFYQRGGFRLAQRDRRFQFIGRNGQLQAGPGARAADLSAFDADHFPAPRPAFLAAWLSQPGVVSLAAVEGSRVTGYGVLRRCRAGRKVGPLFATSAEVAEAAGRPRRRRAGRESLRRRPGAQPGRPGDGPPLGDARGLRLRPDVPRRSAVAPRCGDLRGHHLRAGVSGHGWALSQHPQQPGHDPLLLRSGDAIDLALGPGRLLRRRSRGRRSRPGRPPPGARAHTWGTACGAGRAAAPARHRRSPSSPRGRSFAFFSASSRAKNSSSALDGLRVVVSAMVLSSLGLLSRAGGAAAPRRGWGGWLGSRRPWRADGARAPRLADGWRRAR